METGEIIIYQAADGQTAIDVRLENETLWLTQRSIAELFDKDSDTIGLHIRNIYKEEELEPGATTEENSVVQKEGNRRVRRKVRFYNLDMILSIGYRVNSKKGTRFRIWANGVLKRYLIDHFAINEKRLQAQFDKFNQLKHAVQLLGNVVGNKSLNTDEATGLLKVITDYTYALYLLDQYDHQTLKISGTTTTELFQITYPQAMEAIRGLHTKFGGGNLFGNEKDESFQGSLAAIYQTFDGMDLYPSVEEKAANLLYFVVKNHSFSDGNKRIAAFLFVWFMDKNTILYKEDGEKRIHDNALVALTLMIAESKPEEKDVMVKVVVNLINNKNA